MKFSPDRSNPDQEDFRRRASRTFARASFGYRKRLLSGLRERNPNWGNVFELEALFFERRADAPQKINLDPALQEVLPEEFFSNPTDWIESQPIKVNMLEARRFKGPPTNADVLKLGHDADLNRTKSFAIGTTGIFSKRLNPKLPDFSEAERAREAYACGIPTPRILGTIEDQGNLYVWFESIPGMNLDELETEVFDTNWEATLAAVEPRLGDEAKQKIASIREQAEIHEPMLGLLWDLRRQRSAYIREYGPNFDPGPYDYPSASEAELRGKAKSLLSLVREGLKQFVQGRADFMKLRNFMKLEATEELIDVLMGDLTPSMCANNGLNNRYFREVLLDECQNNTPYYDPEEGIRTHEIQHIVKQNLFGKSPDPKYPSALEFEVAQLKALSLSKGPEHSDLDGRNIILEWDDRNLAPGRREDGSLNLLVVDWEPGMEDRRWHCPSLIRRAAKNVLSK